MPSKKKTAKKATKKKTAKQATKKKATKSTTRKKTASKAKAKGSKKSCDCKKKCQVTHAFWVNNGPVAHSLEELLVAMENMTDKQYAHHTKGKGNDFATWIKDCLADTDCARRVKRAKTRVGTVRILKNRCSCK